MSARLESAYLFATAAQWDTCLFSGADRDSVATRASLTPEAPYAQPPHRIPSPDAFAPAFTPAGELLWRDAAGRLMRALPQDSVAERAIAPWAISQARRLVSTYDALWAVGAAPGTLECFELDSLARRQVVDIAGALIVDFAADAHGGLLVLIRRGSVFELLALGCGGGLSTVARLDAGIEPTRMANLPVQKRILLLDESGTRLVALVRGSGTPQWTRQLAAFRPCFAATELSSDGRGRVFLTGADGADFGAAPGALVLDDEATLIDSLTLPRAATGVTGARGLLAITDAEGLAVYDTATVAGEAAAVECELITPLLMAPDSDAALPWQRVDAWSTLPEGTTLDLRYGWTEDSDFMERARKLTGDVRLPQSQRLAWLRESLDHWSTPVSFAGSAERAVSNPLAPPLSFPLQDARAGTLWLHLRLRATPGSSLPELNRLRVSYAGSAMLQQLPAVYRRTAIQPGDFLGALVGTLEATSQDLDRRIGALGDLVHPDTAPPAWLDELAEWLGLPWDDALSVAQKRAIVGNAGGLAGSRGTRAGLALLLAALFPGTPPRFRISDVDVDFGFVSLGGSACRGSMLPAVLAGLPRDATVLSRKTILGRARLPCAGAMPSATRALAGRLYVDLVVDGETRRAAEPWLGQLLDSMVPANLRMTLRWRTPVPGADPADPTFAPAPQPHLGRDAITGYARLPAGRAPTLWP
jgi:phage tail-like protein